MKILFIYKGRYHVRETITIEYLSSIAKEKGFKTNLIYDQDLFGITDNVYSKKCLNQLVLNKNRILKNISSYKPDFAVFIDNFNRRKWNNELNNFLKYSNIKTVLINQLSELTFCNYDYVLNGEAEQVFQHFINALYHLHDFGPVFYDNSLVDLNSLPLSDKNLFEKYINLRNSYLIYASKGCPYSCSYCEETLFKNKFTNKFFRLRSPDNIINELLHAKKKYQIKEVIFKDSVLTLNNKWINELLTLYKKYINIPYKCFGKVENFNLSIAKMLKESRCYCVEFGLQTFNEHLRKKILYRSEKIDQFKHALCICDQIKLKYDIDHMFGIPGETINDHIYAAKIYNQFKELNRIKCHNLVYYENSSILKFAPLSIKNENNYRADFFSDIAVKGKIKRINKSFQKFYKILPLLSNKKIINLLIKNNNWKIFNYIPEIIIILLQLILALKNKDKRFFFYLKYYPLKIKKVIFN